MSFWGYIFVGVCLFGLCNGFSRGLLKEVATLVGSFVGFLATPLVCIGLFRGLQGLMERSPALLRICGEFGALVWGFSVIVLGVLMVCALPLAVMAFRFISQQVEVFLLGIFKYAPNILNNRLLGACVGAFRYVVYSAVAYWIISWVWQNR